MITCEKLKATISSGTCIARQKNIAKNNGHGNGKHWGNNGSSWLNTTVCQDCKIGLKLYEKSLQGSKKMKEVDKKRCSKKDCLKLLPATLEYFHSMPKSQDGLSYYCKECQRKISRDNYDKRKAAEKPKKLIKPNDHLRSEPKVDETKPLRIKKMTQELPKKNIPLKQTCSTCDRTLEINTDNFHRNVAMETGFTKQCKDCRNRNKRILRGHDDQTILLDFSNYPEILGKLNDWAADNMRDPGMQIIFALKNDVLAKREAG